MRAAELAIPCLIGALLIYAFIKKVNIYKAFVEGAADALPELVRLIAPLAAMMTAIEVMRVSGLAEAVSGMLARVTEPVGIDGELLPIILLRPFSGSAALGLLEDVLKANGADGYIGRAASIIVGSTETVFYTTAVYFGAVGVTKTRHAIPAALIAGAVGTAAGLILARIPF